MPDAPTKPKPWYQSKTIWANLAMGSLMVLAAPEVRTLLGPQALSVAGAVAAVVNIALRFITAGAIAKT